MFTTSKAFISLHPWGGDFMKKGEKRKTPRPRLLSAESLLGDEGL